MAELDFIDVLRQAKASDADMPFPSGTPEALLQHNAPRSLEEFPSRKDPEPAAEVDSEEKSGGGGDATAYVTNISWDSDVGQLVITKSDGSTSNIAFSDCP